MSWGGLYALIVLETGWTWEYVDEEMTLVRLDGFLGLWRQTPPLRTMLRAIGASLGLTPAAGGPSAPAKKPGIGAYIEGFASAGIAVERKASNG